MHAHHRSFAVVKRRYAALHNELLDCSAKREKRKSKMRIKKNVDMAVQSMSTSIGRR